MSRTQSHYPATLGPLLGLGVVLAALLVLLLAGPAQAGSTDTVQLIEAGEFPSTSAIAQRVSVATFEQSDRVVIGRDDAFADSLASGLLQSGAPLLLVPSQGPVPADVAQEIERLGASEAVVLGGTAAIAPAVATELSGLGLDVERVEGPTRIETALAVARSAAPEADTVILARAFPAPDGPQSQAFADALAAGGVSARQGWPILLTETDRLSGPTAAFLASSDVNRVIIVGGTAAVAESVADEIRDLDVTVDRAAGPSRSETAIAVNALAGDTDASGAARVIITDGQAEDAWAGGFALASHAARFDAPIVLTLDTVRPAATRAFLSPGVGGNADGNSGDPVRFTCAVQPVVCDDTRVTAGADPDTTLEPVAPGGPTPALPETDGSTYQLDPVAWDIPTNGTDAVKTTTNFQAAIDDAASRGVARFEVPGGTYLVGIEGNDIYTGGLQLPDNFEFVMADDTVIQLVTHDKWNACTIAVTERTDVVIRGGTIRGDRDTHIFTPREGGSDAHDEGHLICIQNESERVLVDDVTLTRATGDGILLVGQRGDGSSVKDITITGSDFDTNRRQGISIVGGVRVLIEGNEIHHTNGTAPQFGIDVESLRYESRDITIRDNYFHHNAGGDIVNTDGRNVLIEDNRLEEGEGNRNIDGPIVFWPRADMTIRRNTLQVRTGSVNGKVGIIGYSYRDLRPRTNPATNWIYDNVCDGCGFYIYNTSNFRVMRNTFEQGYIAVRDVTDLVLIDNEVGYDTACWPYRFLRVAGYASGNTHNGDAKDLGLTPNAPWDGCWIN